MSAPKQKWLRGLQTSALFRPPPQNANQKQTEVVAYVNVFYQYTSESFVDDIGELVRSHYPSQKNCLLDDVLATFVLHHPEHGHAILHALLSCVIDGTLVYNKKTPPFRSFVSLLSPSVERDFSEQWALACGEILRVLTHYNRPTFKSDSAQPSAANASPSTSIEASGKGSQEDSTWEERERKSPARLLTPWITDSLLAASMAIRNDYFRWCGGFMGKYAAGEELRPPTTVGHGKRPELLPSTPRWAVANAAAVILSVCDYEVARYETADLTASAVPALLIRPSPPTFQEERLAVLGLPPLEPFARLFHRYYAIATPGATQRLLLGLLESPPFGAQHGLLVAVALVEILRAIDDCNSSIQLPRDWLPIHFLKPVGAAMAMRSGPVADGAAALLFHIFSQPALLLPPPSHCHPVSSTLSLYGCATLCLAREEAKAAGCPASENATAAGLAALMVGHGPDVEWRICALWEAALGLRPLSPQVVEIPKAVLPAPFRPPSLSWNLMRPVFRILEYLPAKSASRACLRRIFTATMEAILQRTFPHEEVKQEKDDSQRMSQAGGSGSGVNFGGMAELRAMVHCLFTESFLTPNLAAQLLSDALTLCMCHDAKREGARQGSIEGERPTYKELYRPSIDEAGKNRGAVATFDSYVVAAVCALACEVRLLSFSPARFPFPKPALVCMTRVESNGQVSSNEPRDGQRSSHTSPNRFPIGVASVVEHTKRLGLLELLLSGSPSSAGTRSTDDTTPHEILGESIVAAHMSNLLGQSRACLHSLTEIMKCEWDPGIRAQAAAVLARIESNGGLGFSSNQGRSSDGSMGIALPQDTNGGLGMVARESDQVTSCENAGIDGTHQKSSPIGETRLLNGEKQKSANGVVNGHIGKQIATLPLEAADVAALLCKDRRNGSAVTASLRPVIIEKQHLAIGSVALLCQRLVSCPEMPNSMEGTSAECGWHQVVEALCNMADVLPEKVVPFIVTQAETQLQPWTGKDDVQSQKSAWRVNVRIVSLLSALLHLCHNSCVVKVVVQDGILLRRATDGLTIDGEACILPQLELLEAAGVVAQAALKWEEPNQGIAHQSFSLLRERLPAIVRCLSHSSAHVRAMSLARLRDLLYFEPFRSYDAEGVSQQDATETGNLGDWRNAVEQCVAWEVHYRRAGGMSIALLTNAATTLGCSIPS